MGLGLHGGGVETAKWLSAQGARIVCTDLRDREVLASSVEALAGFGIRFVLGHHDPQDFEAADIIVKNPAVPANSPFIVGRSNLETDISLFLRELVPPVVAITGSKGKSTAATALHAILSCENAHAYLGGNITMSPLSFVDKLTPDDTVVLELSSWQLADLRGKGLLRPKIACITNLMRDHQNRYSSFAEYESDKRVIYQDIGSDDWCVFPDDERGFRWADECGSNVLLAGYSGKPPLTREAAAWLDPAGGGWMHWDGRREELLPRSLMVPGLPFRQNALIAAAMARLLGCRLETIHCALRGFQGVPYRMEIFLEADGIQFCDDTSATIPEACSAAVQSFRQPVVLIAGGTDKELDFESFDSAASRTKAILMLEGTATEHWLPRLKKLGATAEGPFPDMDSAVVRAIDLADAGDVVLLSPGAASFGMFNHEFERGDAFKRACRNHTNTSQ